VGMLLGMPPVIGQAFGTGPLLSAADDLGKYPAGGAYGEAGDRSYSEGRGICCRVGE